MPRSTMGGVFAHDGVQADVVESADVRMIELRDRPRFAVEAFAEERIGCERLRKNLDGDDAVQAGIAGAIHLAHAAGSQCGLDLVRAEPAACGQRHSRSGFYSHYNQIGSSMTSAGRLSDEELLAIYDERYVDIYDPHAVQRIERLLPLFALTGREDVADFGCGNGVLLELIAPRVREY